MCLINSLLLLELHMKSFDTIVISSYFKCDHVIVSGILVAIRL